MHTLEIIGFLTGILGVYLTQRQNPWCFPVGIASVTISMFLFYNEKLYADALQQIVYLILLSYGWQQWVKPEKNKELEISTIPLRHYPFFLVLVPFTALSLGYILHNFTDASMPWADAAASSIAFAAQYLVAKKKIENWFLWMVVNTAYIIIYLMKGLPLYAVLSLIYLFLSFTGLVSWKKELKTA